MPLQADPYQLTTAFTDGLIALVSLACVPALWRRRRVDPQKVALWIGVLVSMACASGLGGIPHGLRIPSATAGLIWQAVYLLLGVLVALFFIASCHDALDPRIARRLLPPALLIGLLFPVIPRLLDIGFLAFILYEGLGMLVALGLYLRLALRGRGSWVWLMSLAVALNIAAAAAQAMTGIRIEALRLDNNGLFHLIQLPAIAAAQLGVLRALGAAQPAKRASSAK